MLSIRERSLVAIAGHYRLLLDEGGGALLVFWIFFGSYRLMWGSCRILWGSCGDSVAPVELPNRAL